MNKVKKASEKITEIKNINTETINKEFSYMRKSDTTYHIDKNRRYITKKFMYLIYIFWLLKYFSVRGILKRN